MSLRGGTINISIFSYTEKTEAWSSKCPADPGPQRQPSASKESLPPFSLAADCPPTQTLPPLAHIPNPSSLELVLPGAADLGGESLGQLLQAAGVLELNLGFPAEELLEVLQQLQPRLGLLLQAFELLHQLRADLCGQRQGVGRQASGVDSCAEVNFFKMNNFMSL